MENRKLWLKCGGFITIDRTEALTAIDVNTGKYTGNNNFNVILFAVLVGVYMYLGLKNIKASNGYIVATL